MYMSLKGEGDNTIPIVVAKERAMWMDVVDTVTDFVPGVGEAKTIGEASLMAYNGNHWGAAGMAALGVACFVIPGVTPGLAKLGWKTGTNVVENAPAPTEAMEWISKTFDEKYLDADKWAMISEKASEIAGRYTDEAFEIGNSGWKELGAYARLVVRGEV